MKVFEILDQGDYSTLRGTALRSVYVFKSGHWKCLDLNGDYFEIKFQLAVLGVSTSETEYGVGKDVKIVGVMNDPVLKKSHQISFSDVKDFLELECDDENIWDVPLDNKRK